jgi:hypothetical protein
LRFLLFYNINCYYITQQLNYQALFHQPNLQNHDTKMDLTSGASELAFNAAEINLGFDDSNRGGENHPTQNPVGTENFWIVEILKQSDTPDEVIVPAVARMGYTTDYKLLRFAIETRTDLCLNIKSYKRTIELDRDTADQQWQLYGEWIPKGGKTVASIEIGATGHR